MIAGWEPLLTGADRDDAVAAVAEIAADLRRVVPSDATLARGAAGLALFEAGLASWTGGGDGRVAPRLREAVELAGRLPGGPSLWEGLSGVGLSLHLCGQPGDDVCDGIEEALVRALSAGRWTGDFDLARGLAGIGVFGLERARSGRSPLLVELALARLEELAAGLVLPVLDVGVAHGLAGVVGLLASCVALGVARERSETLLDAAVRALVALRLPDGCAVRFPTRVGTGRPPGSIPSAWCAGDPGLAAVLYRAGIVTGRADHAGIGLETAWLAARRTLGEAGVGDPCLCHGSAGLAHLFHRFHRWTGQAEFREAAVEWYRWTLDMRAPGSGIGGYPGASLLEGAAGVGLALMAATGTADPVWDRALLLS